MLILGIETSCDETSVALVDCRAEGHRVITERTASQIDIHRPYGGVVPEVAGRQHAEAIVPLIGTVLAGQPRPEVIAITAGPGLITALLVGVEAARTLSYAWGIPLVAVNHIAGHIHSVEIGSLSRARSRDQKSLTFPVLALVASGGHTELILMRGHGDYHRLGATRDDAAGEAFDKVAKLLGLPYPGGPEISRLAAAGSPNAIPFPRPMLAEDNLDFSFAGLKTAALYWLRDNQLAAMQLTAVPLPAGIFGQSPDPPTINDFCASFEAAIVDVLVEKTLRAAKQIKPKTIILAGGVAANKTLRQTLAAEISHRLPATGFQLPANTYCMDNAAMIAVAGYYQARQGKFPDWQKLDVDPNWKIG
ncbi:MAG: tRNA (adenosine(37)-N6)-threonylcarbamoyltransferase complex transferase subunit TsaD [Candidatus Magasanikbacteria bacterium]|nr:tRNA (adenosine(37)-N6)-threonylcarbamoyltransferase complex transferase subunit TsaD [Candidatus Magasanikbacteria bacterium]